MKPLNLALKRQPIVYITRDLERALGASKTTNNYFIITNTTPFAKETARTNPNILLVKSNKMLDTRELLEQPKTKQLCKKLKNPSLLVFKNTPTIERYCREQGLKLLNPSAALANTIEEKISQIDWLRELKKYLPPHQVVICKNTTFSGAPFILQFNRAHTGSGTMLIESHEQLKKIQTQFPDRPVKISKFIAGPLFTNNNVVWGKQILIGNINYQITGLPPFTERPFATIGNDWHLPHTLLTAKQIKAYHTLATAIGKKMAKSGWKGLFGIDTVLDEKTGKLYLLEINARQPASTTYESTLQTKSQVTKNREQFCTTFEAHLAALSNIPYSNDKLIPIKNGAQIIQKRILNKKLPIKKIEKKLLARKITIIPYINTEPESDWLRIQSPKSIMKKHTQLNEQGENIKALLAHP